MESLEEKFEGFSADENNSLLSEHSENRRLQRQTGFGRVHVTLLYIAIFVLLGALSALKIKPSIMFKDPSLALYSPANDAVRYKTVTFEPHFFARSRYVGTDTERVDALWRDLYDFGTSEISPQENSRLLNSTLPAPKDPNAYITELHVFHDLHCLNMLRKVAYPDEYPQFWVRGPDGRVDHLSQPGFHIDHCIDTLRQTLICNADVTPIKFHHNIDNAYNVYPAVYATHTCRDYDSLKEWALDRQVELWKLDIPDDQGAGVGTLNDAATGTEA